MPKIARNSLVNLTAFRQRNGILQKDLADYLGVSRGYISLVESGRSNLSPENIGKLFANPYHWNDEDLVPAFTRLCQVQDYLCITKYGQREDSEISDLIPPDGTVEAIKYGYIDIPVDLVDKWCADSPELNREWLLTGKGKMITEGSTKVPSQIEVLQAKIDKLEAAIEEYKTTVERLVGSLSKQITEALQVMSNK